MVSSKYWVLKNENFEFIPKTKMLKAPENVVYLVRPVYLSNGVNVKLSVVYKRKKKINCSRLSFMYKGYIIHKSNIEHTAYYANKFGDFVDDLNRFNKLSNQELAGLLEKAHEKACSKIKKEKEQIEKLIINLTKKSREKEKALRDLNEIFFLTRR